MTAEKIRCRAQVSPDCYDGHDAVLDDETDSWMDDGTFNGSTVAWKGAICAGQMIPSASWLCSMAAATTRLTPMP